MSKGRDWTQVSQRVPGIHPGSSGSEGKDLLDYRAMSACSMGFDT